MSRRHFHQSRNTPEPRVEGRVKRKSSAWKGDGNKRALRKHLDQYCHDATLHGLRYIGDRSLTWFERIFFVCVFVIAVSLSAYLTISLWNQWAKSTIVTMSSFRTPLITLPFPAITICNSNSVRRSIVQHFARDSIEHSMVQDFCTQGDVFPNTSTTWGRMRQFLTNVSQPCDEMIIDCMYGSRPYNCSQLFEPVVTDSGICCRFNGISDSSGDAFRNNEDKNWHIEKGFKWQNMSKDPYSFPRPFIDSGAGFGLMVTLNANNSEYYCSMLPSAGFGVLVHEPHGEPVVYNLHHLIAYGHVTRMIITPDMQQSDSEIRRIPKEDRKCLFQDENPLKYYRTYSEHNCVSECAVRLSYDECGCVQSFQRTDYPNVEICTINHMDCLLTAASKQLKATHNAFTCQCLPACWDLSYKSTLSSSELLDNSEITKTTGLRVNDLAVLKVFFVERSLRAYEKRPQVTFTDFLSNIGGILGLFLGFSLISIAELFYFICIRPYCIKRHASSQSTRMVSP